MYGRVSKSSEPEPPVGALSGELPFGSLCATLVPFGFGGVVPFGVSPFGVYDLNGNINEWVFRPKEKTPNRSGLKGGWWGPVRGRCRPTVGFHKEEDYGYEAGFRCCKDAEAP